MAEMSSQGLGPGQVLTVMVVAATASAFLVGLVRRRAGLLGLLDVPNSRSSHRVPTPRGGGLGILAGLALGVIVMSVVAPGVASRKALILIACSLVVGLVGLIDDRTGLSARLRLGIHIGAAGILVGAVGPVLSVPLPALLSVPLGSSWITVPATVLWVAAVTNFFNFMDGVDGLAGGQAIASCVGVIVAGSSVDAVGIAAALGGASAGFLLYNWPPASIFMGDVGSGSTGFLLAGLPLLAPPERRSAAVLSVALGLAFFIVDPALTLARRAWRREALMMAHREHLYQRLIPAGSSGGRVTGALLAGAAVLAVSAALGYRHPELNWIGVCLAVIFVSVECALASRV